MNNEIIVQHSPKAPISEAVRLLRTNLSFITSALKNKLFLVTSSIPGEGKSWITSNLAVAFAQSNKKVLIIDTDLRKGKQHKNFGVENEIGFSNFLIEIYDKKIIDDKDLESFKSKVVKTNIDNVYLLPAGPTPQNPSELLQVSNVKYVLSKIKLDYDVVLLDTPPVSIVTDSLILCNKVDNVVLVAAAEQTKLSLLVNAKKSIENVNGKIAGVVLNKMPLERRKEYTKYYSHYELKENENNMKTNGNKKGDNTVKNSKNIEDNESDLNTKNSTNQ